MKKIILQRIEQIRKESKNFDGTIGKWKNLSFNNIPLKDISYNELSKKDLLFVFEIIIKQYYI